MGKSSYSGGVSIIQHVPQVYYKVNRGEALELFIFVIKLVVLVTNTALNSITLNLLPRHLHILVTTVNNCSDCLVTMVTMVTDN